MPKRHAADLLRRPGTVVCRGPGGSGWRLFREPEAVLTAWRADEVLPLLAEAEAALAAGRWVAGALAYEAAPAFDPAHQTHAPDALAPLAWFGIYRRAEAFRFPEEAPAHAAPGAFVPSIGRAAYLAAVARVKAYIHEGDIYQANLTFPALAPPVPDPAALFLALCRRHPVPCAAWIQAGGWQLASLSPELFLDGDGDTVRSRPMKGTARRGRWTAEDRAAARALAHDAKNRAENVMITDMVRNDLGRVCVPGSIRVEPLCRVETYATVHQMVSEVHGRLRPDVSPAALLAATFPAASITGAPKIRAMAIIRELEPFPRRFYTGAVGVFAPDGGLRLNVAIRTLLCLPGRTELGIGSGVVADSQPAEEWRECRLKARFVRHRLPEFDVLETMLWRRESGFAMLSGHLARARGSQRHFGRPWRPREIRNALAERAAALSDGPHDQARVRLLVDRQGQARTEMHPLAAVGWGRPLLSVRLASRPVREDDIFLFHKTTRRQRYDTEFHAALAAGCDEVLFRNRRGELTEGAISNLLVKLDGHWFTPPLRCGLLPGLWRSAARREFRARERILTVADLHRAEAILLGNSVRGAAPARLVDRG